MNIHQIRNATLVIEYGGKKFLIDPFLADKGTYPAFPGSAREEYNPLFDLPVSIDYLIDVDAVIVTHLHLDHWDDVAKVVLPKDIKLFTQNKEDAEEIKSAGFVNVEVLKDSTTFFEGIQLIKTKGEHGRGKTRELMGNVIGLVFKNEKEKTLYLAGDTVWCTPVQEAIETHNPEVVILNAGDNKFFELGSLIMGKEDVYEVHKAIPSAKIIASYMEAVNHWGLSRKELRKYAVEKGFSSQLLIPEDGECNDFLIKK